MRKGAIKVGPEEETRRPERRGERAKGGKSRVDEGREWVLEMRKKKRKKMQELLNGPNEERNRCNGTVASEQKDMNDQDEAKTKDRLVFASESKRA